MRTDRQAIMEVEDEVIRLNAMGKLLGILLQGDISKLGEDGVVKVAEDEASSLYWLGQEIRNQIEKLDKVFYGETQGDGQ
jgi:hypothetical protein